MNNKSVNYEKFRRNLIIYFCLTLILGITIGYTLRFLTTISHKAPAATQISQDFSESRAGGYQFTNPLLDCDNFRPSILNEHVSLYNDLNNYVNNAINIGVASHISIYFRSLNNGPWIGINEDHSYSPASLLKVPILIAVLKKAETDSSLLRKKIRYSKPLETRVNPNIVEGDTIKIGNTYTVDELLEYMIIKSDNNAKEMLINLIGNDYLTNVMIDLGVNLREKDLSKDFLSVKEYSSFYRIMYNASYLNRDFSEKALKMLSRTDFIKGIPEKLPKNIKISHKFGERGFEDSNLKQLHDCGIVYVPDKPYLLCVMTLGYDFDNLNKIISEISEIVYNNVIEK